MQTQNFSIYNSKEVTISGGSETVLFFKSMKIKIIITIFYFFILFV